MGVNQSNLGSCVCVALVRAHVIRPGRATRGHSGHAGPTDGETLALSNCGHSRQEISSGIFGTFGLIALTRKILPEQAATNSKAPKIPEESLAVNVRARWSVRRFDHCPSELVAGNKREPRPGVARIPGFRLGRTDRVGGNQSNRPSCACVALVRAHVIRPGRATRGHSGHAGPTDGETLALCSGGHSRQEISSGIFGTFGLIALTREISAEQAIDLATNSKAPKIPEGSLALRVGARRSVRRFAHRPSDSWQEMDVSHGRVWPEFPAFAG